MKARFSVSTFLFYGLTVFMAVVIVTSFVAALAWVNKPFPGFLLYDFPFTGSMSMEGWAGRHAGIKFLEQVVSVDGEPVWKGEEVYSVVSKKEPGTPVSYVLESKDERREITVPVGLFSGRDFLLVFLCTYLGGVAVFCLGFIVFLLKPNVSTSWVFFFLCFFLSFYMITAFDIQSTYFFVKFHYFSLCLMAPFFFHLGSIFPEKKNLLNRFPFLEYMVYVPTLLFVTGYEIYLFGFVEILKSDALSWLPAYKQMGIVNRMFTLLCVVSLIVFVVHSLFRGSTVVARQRAKMILFGVTIAFAPSATIMLVSAFVKFTFPWNFLVFFVVFFPASIAYSIARHNLFDADTIIRRTVGYVVMTAVVIGAYVGVSVGLNVILGKYQLAQSRTFPILFTLGIILVFNPLRDRIQAVVDRLFFRKEYDYGEVVERMGTAMTSLLELPQILKHLIQTFMQDMFINTSSVMLLTSAGTEYQVFLADGEAREDVEKKAVKRDDPLIEIIEKKKGELTKYDVLEDPEFKGISDECLTNFNALHASLMMPLVFQDRVTGILALGEKKSGKGYDREDVDLLRTIASQGAVAIENARLFQENLEKQRMEEELSIARDLQMSMLPAACPEIEGVEIAALSTPAKEVGGDFFDFIEMGEDGIGFVVGDVTGKSVSGALVMSASRSVFRMLSEEKLTVGDIMLRANRRIKQDIKTGMFVALLYAVYDTRERILSMCSAGQTQPVHLSGKTGAVNLVETEGDTFPLGILDEADYRETRLQLEPGDKVVFYTDGIVEAMNEKEEIFGFERLLKVIKEARSLNAESLLKEILERAESFVGGAPQHDDLTVIVISIGE